MSNKSKTLLWIIAFGLGLLTDQVYSAVSGKYAELLPTKSGTFVVQKGRIYELAELEPPIDRALDPRFK